MTETVLNSNSSCFTLAIGGDTIINRTVDDKRDRDVAAICGLFRDADLAYANCETLFHDYDGLGVYPAVEAGWSYMRSSPRIAMELRRLGFRLMSTANNHAFDYSYGGLFSTLAALDAAGIAHAGAGPDLAHARVPAFVDAGRFRVALVSMTTTSTLASRAGMPHDGIPGRPGVNPLRFHFTADATNMQRVLDLHRDFGWWIARIGEREWQINPPGLHNTITRYVLQDEPGMSRVLDERDVAANLRAIRNARAYADIVLVHIHNHEWDQDLGTQYPASFMPEFARRAVEAGASVVVAQGGHAPFRGVEVHHGAPIFYDPGDLFSMASTIERYPHDFYERHDLLLDRPLAEALTVDSLKARGKYSTEMVQNPEGGTRQGRGQNGFVPLVHFDEQARPVSVDLHPFEHRHGAKADIGLPFRASDAQADMLIARLAELSQPFGTDIKSSDGIARIAF
ncbi:CapA family protein [Pseudochelatococcus lubricantis]|uniref:CapA family protein n=1 Tax=Pseudochelatococcus lubricantis TaxID=1538102 RepID=UPI0035E4713E